MTFIFLPVVAFSSDPWNSYLQTQIKSLSVKEEQSNDTQAFITVSVIIQSIHLFLENHASVHWFI